MARQCQPSNALQVTALQGSLPNGLCSGEESSGPSGGGRWLNSSSCCFMGQNRCFLFGFHHPCSLWISQKGFLERLWKTCCDDRHVYLTSVAVVNNSTKNYVRWRIGEACHNLQKVNEWLFLGCMFANLILRTPTRLALSETTSSLT